jgi:hypothetical protein
MFQTALTWNNGADDGGSPIIDYRILYSIGSGDYTVLRYGINSNSFVATGLNTGTTYKFKVQARNAQGYSDFSIDQEIQTADKPEKPAPPLTSFNPDAITVQWTEPTTNGAVISSYAILIRSNDQVTFYEELINCDGRISSIISS